VFFKHHDVKNIYGTNVLCFGFVTRNALLNQWKVATWQRYMY